jgi:nucleotide-binding universal stress UspA family protein
MWVGAQTIRMPTVLLGTDGSEYADKAAEYAVELARERGADLHVLCIIDRRMLDEPALSSEELMTILVEDRCGEAISTVEEIGASAGVTVVGASRHGVPHEEIHDHATKIDADVIVVGHHGNRESHCGGVRRRLLERTDREVVLPPDTADERRVQPE